MAVVEFYDKQNTKIIEEKTTILLDALSVTFYYISMRQVTY